MQVGPTPPGIEVGKRIGLIELGASREQVLGRLGAPTRERRSGRSSVLQYQDEGISLRVANERVRAVATRSEAYRTDKEISVGSTRAEVRSRLTNASCDATSCVIAGRRVRTIFTLEAGRVVKIRVERRLSC